MKAAKAILTSN